MRVLSLQRRRNLTKELFYEDVKIGTQIPSLVKKPTLPQLVQYCGATSDFYRLHYDKDFAISMGFDEVVIQGPLKGAWLGQMLSEWIGENGTIKKFSCSYRRADHPGDTITCKGKVISKYVEGDDYYVECDIWAENSKGERTTPGKAVVVLPSKVSR